MKGSTSRKVGPKSAKYESLVTKRRCLNIPVNRLRRVCFCRGRMCECGGFELARYGRHSGRIPNQKREAANLLDDGLCRRSLEWFRKISQQLSPLACNGSKSFTTCHQLGGRRLSGLDPRFQPKAGNSRTNLLRADRCRSVWPPLRNRQCLASFSCRRLRRPLRGAVANRYSFRAPSEMPIGEAAGCSAGRPPV